MTRKKVIAVLGGAFDPIHSDHLRMADECLNYSLCDEVWLIPSPDRWDKQPHASAHHRLTMAQKAVENKDRIFVSDFEIAQGEFRGSYTLLKKLSESNPSYEFRLVVGSDTYPSIPNWRDIKNSTEENKYNGHLLLQEYSLILIPRDTTPMPDAKTHETKGFRPIFVLNTACVGDISSTLVRERKGLIQGLVPELVSDYIHEKKLYGTSE